jgi:hypothetical protein
MIEIPSNELAALDRKDVLSARFRRLLNHALDEGLLVGVARETSRWAVRIPLGQISIHLIFQGPRRDRQKMKPNQPSRSDRLFETASSEARMP